MTPAKSAEIPSFRDRFGARGLRNIAASFLAVGALLVSGIDGDKQDPKPQAQTKVIVEQCVAPCAVSSGPCRPATEPHQSPKTDPASANTCGQSKNCQTQDGGGVRAEAAPTNCVKSESSVVAESLRAIIKLIPELAPFADEVVKTVDSAVKIMGAMKDVYDQTGMPGFLVFSAPLLWLTRRSWGELAFRLWLAADRPRTQGSEPPPLLPGQRKLIDSLKTMVANSVGPAKPGQLIGLQGDWGCGKSYLLLAAAIDLEKSSEDVAVVPLNVWEHQSEADLHFALLKAVASHRRVLDRCARRYPVRMLLAPALLALARLLPRGLKLNFDLPRIAIASAEVTVPIPWQGVFRAIVDAINDSGLKLVVILDEIDRADPPVAQAVMTMARRALDRPGIIVLLPYVESQLRHKVFNPLLATSPDLLATMHAVLDEFASPDASAVVPVEGNVEDKRDSDQTLPVRMAARYRAALNRSYLELAARGSAHQYRLFRRFSEKYLSHTIRMPVPGLEDYLQLLSDSPLLNTHWRQVLKTGEEEVDPKQVFASVQTRLNKAGHGLVNAQPSLRAVEGAFLRALVNYATSPPTTNLSRHEQLEALLAVAWRIAVFRSHVLRRP